MIKKQYCILLILCVLCLFSASCAPKETEQLQGTSQKTQSPIDAIIEKNIKQYEDSDQSTNAPPSPQVVEDEAELTEPTPPIEDKAVPTEPTSPNANDNADNSETIKIDVDLTALSSTMVYAEVYNIMIDPDSYAGKTIKMNGSYYASYYDETDQYYHFVIIEDATACCAQGLEFIWKGEHNYPEDYPADQTKIEVVGVFGSYEELGQTYYYLEVDDITVME